MEMIQRLRAAARYDGTEILTTPLSPYEEQNLVTWVKEALTHYWGGPKLTDSPLLELQVVRQTVEKNQETPANALRSILRQAIEKVRPEGERRFTGEWILYNILDMKFLEGRKVREVALRLAMSEADLYRKQRVAIEAVAQAIADMEQQARQENLPVLETESQTIIT
jgi:truncated hemoglobin YjbI